MMKELIEILVCPKCRGSLRETEAEGAAGLLCAACGLVYPIQDGIPVMLVDKAIPVAEWPKTE